MFARQVIIVEVGPSPNEHLSLEEKIDRADSKIEGLRGEMGSLDQQIHKLDRKTKKAREEQRQVRGCPIQRRMGIEKGRVERVPDVGARREDGPKERKRLLEMDLKSLELRKELREWEAYREGLKTSQEEVRFDEWMRREEALAYEDWKKSQYSRD